MLDKVFCDIDEFDNDVFYVPLSVNVLKLDMLFLNVAQDEERSREIIRLVIGFGEVA